MAEWVSTPTSRLNRNRQTYAEYDACPECRALPGNPCRERLLPGAPSTLSRPHLSRPKREAKA